MWIAVTSTLWLIVWTFISIAASDKAKGGTVAEFVALWVSIAFTPPIFYQVIYWMAK